MLDRPDVTDALQRIGRVLQDEAARNDLADLVTYITRLERALDTLGGWRAFK